MPKKKTKARKMKFKLPTEPLLMGLGAAAILRDKTYDVLTEALEQTKWMGKSQKQIQSKLLATGEKEYARLMRDVEKSFNMAMKRAERSMPSTKRKK